MERLFWICLAGAAGTGARYLVALWAAQRLGSAFPYGTLIVNLLGCFAIAAVMHAALTLSWSPTVRSAITIGFIGGLTTYSSFNYETSRLLEEGAMGAAALNATVTLVGAFVAGWLGLFCAKQLLGQ
ncbi:MAG: fluoride efflux transporter CrcB [Acidobacteria bacterium]|nr:fluoride efflux transporter CrcB [Acidobacteriota bacterium]